MWHYRTTNGLGFHEYLQLCEDLEMEAMYVCNCGMSCQARHGGGFSEETTKEYLEEALHALEYALGSADTPYGSLRAENGRKEPFRLKYVEIGNENFGPEYNQRYELFYKTLKEALVPTAIRKGKTFLPIMRMSIIMTPLNFSWKTGSCSMITTETARKFSWGNMR